VGVKSGAADWSVLRWRRCEAESRHWRELTREKKREERESK
jgi:hypothetical protein